MTRDSAPDDAIDQRLGARLSSAVGAVLGIAVALLIAVLPGSGAQSARLQSAFSATTPDQCVLAIADRVGEARRSLQGAKSPNARRSDFDGGLIPVSASLSLRCIAPAASPRPALARAQQPGRWPSTARARAPPLA